MVMKLENVVPFGRSLDEYRHMFALSEADLDKAIVGVGDGPASFNAEMSALGRSVVSIDPLYVFSAAEIAARFDAVVDNIIDQVRATPADWVWSYHGSPEQLRQNRLSVLQHFVADYERGRLEHRYLAEALPQLGFADNSFDLALCSHLLFLYSEHLSYEFHREAVLEMLRVAAEVRIFPLLTLMLEVSPYIEALRRDLESSGYVTSIEPVDYEMQRGGNEMLRIQKVR